MVLDQIQRHFKGKHFILRWSEYFLVPKSIGNQNRPKMDIFAILV